MASDNGPKPTMYFPTKEACEDYKVRRFHSDYDTLSSAGNGESGANSGFFGDALNRLAQLTENAIGVDIPGFGPPGIEDQKMFLAGPQFKNKAGNILQQPVAQFSLGLYNGPQSAWWSSKRQQNKPQIDDKDPIGRARTTNSVWVTARKNIPYKIKTRKENVNGQDINVSEFDYNGEKFSEPLWKMNILPNWNHEQSLDFSHKHEWGRPEDMFTQLLTTIGGTIAGAARFAERISSVNTGSQSSPDALSQIKADIAATYQKTERLELTVPFTLFTKNNFYRDIFYPIMTMNSLTFPRRTNLKDAAKELIKFGKGAIEGVNGLIDTTKGVTGVTGRIDPDNVDGGVDKVTNFLDNIMPGFRVFAAEPPSYFSIEHSAGLFKFDNCAVTNFEYKYLGPWITTTDHPQDQTSTAGLLDGGNAPRPAKKDFWKFWKTENDVLDISWTRAKMTFPVMAECMITFKVLDPIFGDDWINQLALYQGMWDEVNGSQLSGVRGKPGTDILNLKGLI